MFRNFSQVNQNHAPVGGYAPRQEPFNTEGGFQPPLAMTSRQLRRAGIIVLQSEISTEEVSDIAEFEAQFNDDSSCVTSPPDEAIPTVETIKFDDDTNRANRLTDRQYLELSPRDKLMYKTLLASVGIPVARVQLSECIEALTMDNNTQKVSVSRLIKKLKTTLSPQAFLFHENHKGHFYYMLTRADQTYEDARTLLCNKVAENVQKDIELKLEQNLYKDIDTWNIEAQLDRADDAIAVHLRAGGADTEAWDEKANCNNIGHEIFMGVKGVPALAARLICSRCTVTDECLKDGMRQDRSIAGGLSVHERREIMSMKKEGYSSAAIQDKVTALRAKGFAMALKVYTTKGLALPNYE